MCEDAKMVAALEEINELVDKLEVLIDEEDRVSAQRDEALREAVQLLDFYINPPQGTAFSREHHNKVKAFVEKWKPEAKEEQSQ